MHNRMIEHTYETIHRLILASSSPRRKELVASLDLSLPVSVFSVEVDEHIEPSWQPADAVERLSLTKADAVRKAILQNTAPEEILADLSLILSADTVVVIDGQILGKPASEEEAISTLKRLQGRSHHVYSGVALMYSNAASAIDRIEELLRNGQVKEVPFGQIGQHKLFLEGNGSVVAAIGHTCSRVTFRPMTEDEIVAYVKSGEPMDKAGSYGIQGKGAMFIEKLEGDFYSVMGLPVNLLYQMLLAFGISPFARS